MSEFVSPAAVSFFFLFFVTSLSFEKINCDMGLFAEKFSTSPKKNGAGIKYENKEKENNSTHNVLRYV